MDNVIRSILVEVVLMKVLKKISTFIEEHRQLSFLLFSIASLIFAVGSLFIGGSDQDVQADLADELADLNNQLAVTTREQEEQVNAIIYEQTGVNPGDVDEDRALATEFFTPAFNWRSGEEYNTARNEYIDRLGEDSTFVQTYITENREVEGYNYIDLYDLGAKFESMSVYALAEHDGAIEYIGIVRYYMLQNEEDLANTGELSGSQAIIRFRVNEGAEGSDRYISNITAYPGFSSLINEN